MPSSHLILCRPLLLLPPIPPSIRIFSNESTLRMKGMATHSSILTWRIPWTEELSRLQSWRCKNWTRLKRLSTQAHSGLWSLKVFHSHPHPCLQHHLVLKATFQSWSCLMSVSDFVLFLHFYLLIEQIVEIYMPLFPARPDFILQVQFLIFGDALWELIHSIQNRSIIFSTILDPISLSFFVSICKTR